METPKEWSESAGHREVGFSLDEQRNACLRFAEESGYDVVARYEDTDSHPGEGEGLA